MTVLPARRDAVYGVGRNYTFDIAEGSSMIVSGL